MTNEKKIKSYAKESNYYLEGDWIRQEGRIRTKGFAKGQESLSKPILSLKTEAEKQLYLASRREYFEAKESRLAERERREQERNERRESLLDSLPDLISGLAREGDSLVDDYGNVVLMNIAGYKSLAEIEAAILSMWECEED